MLLDCIKSKNFSFYLLVILLRIWLNSWVIYFILILYKHNLRNYLGNEVIWYLDEVPHKKANFIHPLTLLITPITLGAAMCLNVIFSLSHLCFKYTSPESTLNNNNDSLLCSPIAHIPVASSWLLWSWTHFGLTPLSVPSVGFPNQFSTLYAKAATPIPFPHPKCLLCSYPGLQTLWGALPIWQYSHCCYPISAQTSPL